MLVVSVTMTFRLRDLDNMKTLLTFTYARAWYNVNKTIKFHSSFSRHSLQEKTARVRLANARIRAVLQFINTGAVCRASQCDVCRAEV